MRICWSWTLFVLMVAILALMTLLGGCGQKGALYLPEEPAAADDRTTEQAGDD